MIDFTEGGLTDIWPAGNEDPQIAAISYAYQQALKLIRNKADCSRCYCAVEMLPEEILDYMAVELRSMYYEQDLDIERKRAIIKNTLKWYTYAGTPATVAEMVDVVFGGGRVVEWYDFDEPPYTPGMFDIVTTGRSTPDIMDMLNRLLRKVKNTRSHLRRVVIERELHASTAMAIRGVSVQTCEVRNFIQMEQDQQHRQNAAIYADTLSHTSVRDTLQGTAEAAARENLAAGISQGESRTVAYNHMEQSSGATATIREAQRAITYNTTSKIKEE